MEQLLALLSGAITSIMNYINSQLSLYVGQYNSVVIIHAVGLVCIAPFCIKGLKRPLNAPWWHYIGGTIGIVVVITCNHSIHALDVTTSLVLALVGQTIISLIMDQTGFMGSVRKKIDKRRVLSLAFIVLGAGVMLIW